MRDWSLLNGIVPGTAVLVGTIALVFLVARTGRRWWLVQVPIAAAVGAGVAVGGAWLVNRLFTDQLPTQVRVWVGAAVFGVLLAMMRLPQTRWRSRVLGRCTGRYDEAGTDRLHRRPVHSAQDVQPR